MGQFSSIKEAVNPAGITKGREWSGLVHVSLLKLFLGYKTQTTLPFDMTCSCTRELQSIHIECLMIRRRRRSGLIQWRHNAARQCCWLREDNRPRSWARCVGDKEFIAWGPRSRGLQQCVMKGSMCSRGFNVCLDISPDDALAAKPAIFPEVYLS